jgi:hypothetical protein
MGALVLLVSLLWGDQPEITKREDELEQEGEGVDVSKIPEELSARFFEGQSLELDARIVGNSELMLGLPYIFDGIGEERLPDEDPFIRYDGYDCLTFVEQTLALSLAEDLNQSEEIVLDLRYHSAPRYENRNHFMISQWIPNVLSKGYMVDVTAQIGETRVVQKELIQRNWDRWKGRHRYHLTPEDYPKGEYLLEVVPIDELYLSLSLIQTGDLLIFVRVNNPYNPILVTHLGWFVEGEVPTIRHATKMGKGSVRNDELIWYLNHLHYFDKWPIAGFLVFRPQPLSPADPLPPQGGE